MTDANTLEALLRDTHLRCGRIAIDTMDGENWRATVSHFNGHMVHQPHPHPDPVTALRAALFEDERKHRDLARRYDAAPKLGGGQQIDLEEAIAAAPTAEPDVGCMICEDGGCDACRPVSVEDLLG